MMNDQKVLEKARAYRLAYQAWFEAVTNKSNPEEVAKLTREMMLANKELSDAVTEEAWEELPPIEYPKYEVGEPVIYVNGTKAELGIVKKDCGDDEYFINYHTGDTAARTHARHLVKVSNRYAYHIVRLDPDGNERKKIVGTTTVDEALEKTLLDNCPEIKKELEDYREIKEIAKRYHFDDLARDTHMTTTDEKYLRLFNAAIPDIQADYRKARAFDIIKSHTNENKHFKYLLYMAKYWEENKVEITKELLYNYDFPYTVDEFRSLKEALR